MNDIKQKLFQPEQFDKITIKTLMKKPAAILQLDHDMHTVMEKFDITQSWYLPVLNKERKFIDSLHRIN